MPNLVRRGPLDGAEPIARRGTVTVCLAPPLARIIVRGAPERAYGVELPATPCRAVTQDDRAALWLGPDECLVLAPRFDATSGAAIDISHRQVGLIIEGPLAATVLNGGCPLDLHLDAFPIGMCTRTVFAKAEIVLWRQAERRFHVEVARSFATYLHELLREISRN